MEIIFQLKSDSKGQQLIFQRLLNRLGFYLYVAAFSDNCEISVAKGKYPNDSFVDVKLDEGKIMKSDEKIIVIDNIDTNEYPYFKIILKNPTPAYFKNRRSDRIVGYVFGIRFIAVRGTSSLNFFFFFFNSFF
jgi:hypothetical protein